MITLQLTEQEAQTIIQLMDVAVRAQGLQVAQAALVLTAKIQEAAKLAAAEVPPVPPATE
jgi:hypothetical protein